MTFSEVDRSEPIALHLRAVAESRRMIGEGEAVEGEREPCTVDLAAVLE